MAGFAFPPLPWDNLSAVPEGMPATAAGGGPERQPPSERPEESFDTDLFSRFVEIEEIHFWFAARRRVVRRLLAQLTAGLAPGFRVLDVGCGIGGLQEAMREACPQGRVFGFDRYLEGLVFAHGQTGSRLFQADITRPPFGRGFEVACMFDVLEHLPDDRLVLEKLFGLLAPGGRLFLTVPASPALWSYFDVEVLHYRRYTLEDLREKLQAAGFEVEYLTPYMTWLFPLIYLKRRVSALVEKLRPGRPRPMRQVVAMGDFAYPNPFVNQVGKLLLAPEPGLLARRTRLPFGTSLLTVARRPG